MYKKKYEYFYSHFLSFFLYLQQTDNLVSLSVAIKNLRSHNNPHELFFFKKEKGLNLSCRKDKSLCFSFCLFRKEENFANKLRYAKKNCFVLSQGNRRSNHQYSGNVFFLNNQLKTKNINDCGFYSSRKFNKFKSIIYKNFSQLRFLKFSYKTFTVNILCFPCNLLHNNQSGKLNINKMCTALLSTNNVNAQEVDEPQVELSDTSSDFSSDESEFPPNNEAGDATSPKIDFDNFPHFKPEEWTADKVRQTFIDYFASKGHLFYRGCPIIPFNDPSLLFINSGMNQFKPLILGSAESTSPLFGLKRATNSQKCIRAGGKHNDLDDVGLDVYHHTFFEMLGNWSFGDYFKEDAIKFAWTLLTEVYRLPKDRLYVTYFGGDENTAADVQACEIWKKYLPSNRILPFGAKENFWEMADTGPCGPCSEIHFDRIGNRDASSLVNMDDPSVLEVWNIVFMQFNRENDKSLIPLSSTCVDTGMGLERLLSILQNRQSNYDTDLFMPIFKAIHKSIKNLPFYSAKVGKEDTDGIDTAYRIVADHIRCLTIAIGDNVIPSNEGRGYVLRRMLRRAVRYAMQKLQAPSHEGGWIYKLVDVVVRIFAKSYPQLKERRKIIKSIIKREELQFAKALNKGVDKFNKIIRRMIDNNEGKIISGNDTFLLYATFGFPVDLTKLMSKEIGFDLNEVDYEAKVVEHQKRSENIKFKSSSNILSNLTIDKMYALEIDEDFVPTNDSYKYQWNSEGYGKKLYAKLIAIWDGIDFIDEVCIGNSEGERKEGQRYALIFDKTNFYSEQGGQIGDCGKILKACREFKEDIYDFERLKEELTDICDSADQDVEPMFEVCDVVKHGKSVFHIGGVICGTFKKGNIYALCVDFKRRAATAKNHTATHILNFALMKILGEECHQKGSLVDDCKLRFDFSYHKPVEIKKIIEIVNLIQNIINRKDNVYTSEISYLKALEIKGIRAVFGEVYPDPCRVVSVGSDINALLQESQDKSANSFADVSVELCGGTHVKNTSEIQKIVIVSEEGVAKGIRRICALTGNEALECLNAENNLKKLSEDLADKVNFFVEEKLNYNEKDQNPGEVIKAVVRCEELIKEISTFRRNVESAKKLSLDFRKNLDLCINNFLGKLLAEQKKQSKHFISKGKVLGKKLAEENKSSLYVVHDFGGALAGDSKALDAALQSFVESASNVSALLISSNPFSHQISVASAVSEDMTQKSKMSAKDWIEKFFKEVGGKGGGNRRKAVGCIKECNKFSSIQNALHAATQYAQTCLDN